MSGRDDTLYLKLLQSLLPKGKIWNRVSGSTLTKFLWGLAGEYARIEGRGFDLFEESLPSQISELLTDYEIEYGLYEENINLGKTVEERVQAIVAKTLEYGRTDKEYFEDLAADLGYTIIIEEFDPAWCGVVVCGEACGPLVNMFYWKIWITVEDGINYNIERLIQEIQKFKPAHTLVLFDFYGRGFSEGFNCGFNSQPDWDNSWGGNGYGKIGDAGLGFGRGFSIGFANAYDYDGNNYVGGFSYGFRLGFDRYSGGEFTDGFSIGFSRPH
jgi:uncharacterized protein YmfQ (DUF2313 family)